jgi:hypothetical protein
MDFGPLVLSEAFCVLRTTVVQNVAENRFLPTFTYLFVERVIKLASQGKKMGKNLAEAVFHYKNRRYSLFTNIGVRHCCSIIKLQQKRSPATMRSPYCLDLPNV